MLVKVTISRMMQISWTTVLLFIVGFIAACSTMVILVTAYRVSVMRVGSKADLACKMANTAVKMFTNFF